MYLTLLKRHFIILSILFPLLLAGCSKTEEAKKVSLAGKSVEKPDGIEYPPQDTLWFGFDLRPGQKEDAGIYMPFLKYLESATGRHFSIKFAGNYEDTVKDLGTGVTHFAVVGTMGYVIGEARYGIKYLVRGVNTDGGPGILIAYSSAVDAKTVEAVRAALLAFEPQGKHKDQITRWEKTEMPMGFTEVDELELQKVKALAIKYGLLKGN
ncbi:MAG: PhnD/SsuA/transferrin family substrate-binding protein [Nitrospirae bacterium]|nr:PhnD/SsuA/transferrin family substrate-binding protein [Nitrospirota bacterium]